MVTKISNVPLVEGEEQFCHCGTHRQALVVAEKMMVDMLASDCGAWAFQVGAAIRTLAVEHLSAAGIDKKEIKELGDRCTSLVRRDMTPPDQLTLLAIKKAEQYE